ncbi:hypothetical protein BWZ22_02410 [Seonamhaeicola sp. S2-3]|uniref:hypothetical protein n=1 Tax=Seonamhaeicola sp. S2-3 TaxID=1936081 RepID=UPI0009729C11|nr:hypothetical protein [Seonamhaeicola sp. S2-3]APY10155.1 hypothetical protein BWZ22_02410 [Seonamhaeicola sp. S2-3]
MPKKNNADKIKILGKEFEYVRIDDIKKNPVIFFEEHSVDLCIKAYEILKPKLIYIENIPCQFLSDPLFADLENIRVSASENMELTPLNALNNLKSLWVTFYPGYEPKGALDFSQFPQLETLRYSWSNETKNFSALKNIQSIFIEEYPQLDLKAFSEFDNLKALEISRSKLESLEGIEENSNLIELKITGSSNINTLESLAKASNMNLKVLEINSKNKINGLENIANLNKLQSLTLEGMPSIDCAQLEKNTSLEHLKLKKVKEVHNASSLSKLTKLTSIELLIIDFIENLNFISELPNIETLNILPWYVNSKDGYLPLTKKFKSLNKLETLFKWKDILNHLDEEGLALYKAYFGDSPLAFIKKRFKFHCYEDFSEPYTKKNCNKVDHQIQKLIDRLIEHSDKTSEEKLVFFQDTVNALDKIDEELNLFATGEREYLWDTLDEIAKESGIDVDALEESDSKNKNFNWPVF